MRRLVIGGLFGIAVLWATPVVHADAHRRGPPLRRDEHSARDALLRADAGVVACMRTTQGRFDVLASHLGEWNDAGVWVDTWSVRVHGAPRQRVCVERALVAARIDGLYAHAALWWSSEPGPAAPRLELAERRELEVAGLSAQVWIRFVAQRLAALSRCLPPGSEQQTVVFDASASEMRVLAMTPRGFEECVAHAFGHGRPDGWARVWIRQRQPSREPRAEEIVQP